MLKRAFQALLNKLDFSLPCSKLVCKRNLKRPHLTCLTCTDRRFWLCKINREDYVQLKEGSSMFFANTLNPMTLPKCMYVQYLIINQNHSPSVNKAKNILLKPLRTLAEVIANW